MYNYTYMGQVKVQKTIYGVSSPPYIFQDKIDKMIQVFKFMCMYVNNLLIQTTGYWTVHLDGL